MPAPDDSTELPPADPDALFDVFMERALELQPGEELEPAAFLAEHPGLAANERIELEERLLAIARLAVPAAAEPACPTTPGEDLNRTLGEYRLMQSLGGGAMGEVYLAEQSSLGRLVALKTQRAELVNSPSAATRFEREARALGSVTHPSVVGVHDFGEEGGVRYLAMELVPGRSLKELLEEPRVGEPAPTPVAITRWGCQLARGLEAVHAAGLVHRDVKPGNVRITEDEAGRAVLVDFGLARVGDSSELSRTGEFIGSPAYASPEQVRGDKNLDGRSDVYSLGATLYRALAGRAPFEGEHLEAVLHGVLTRDPEPLQKRVPGLPHDLCLVVHKAMEKLPEERYRNATELAEDLEAVLELRPVSAKPVGPWGRGVRWVRRNRLAAGGFAVAGIAVLAALVYVGEAARRDRTHTRERARALLVEAEDALREFHTARLELVDEEAEYDQLSGLQEYQHLGPERGARLAELEGRVRLARERRDKAFVRGENQLASALRLNPSLQTKANELGARLVLERLIEAIDRGDKEAASFLSVELERLDPNGEQRALAFPFTHLTLSSQEPGTTAWVMRYEALDELTAGGEARLVPVPIKPLQPKWQPAVPAPFGSEVLRIASGLAEGDLITHYNSFPIRGGPLVAAVDPGPNLGEPALQPGDRLIAIDELVLEDPVQFETILIAEPDVAHQFHFEAPKLPGVTPRTVTLTQDEVLANGVKLESLVSFAERVGGSARVIHKGESQDITLPANTTLRPSFAAPVLLPDGQSPLNRELALEPGNYLILTRAPGCRLTRHFVQATPGAEIQLDATPTPVAFAPAGFVFVGNALDVQRDFWIQEREITSAEYLEYLNQPEQLRLVDQGLLAQELVRAPRAANRNQSDLMWPRHADGQFYLPPSWPVQWPVLGVSLEDALAFVRWKNETATNGTYALPDGWQTSVAGGAHSTQRYSWGTRFNQRFANTCFSRGVARPEPVLANPRDESVFGVYDTCGNALEWVTSWYDETRKLHHAIGGSWAQARIDTLAAGGGLGLTANTAGGETGFRLTWIPPTAPGQEVGDEGQ